MNLPLNIEEDSTNFQEMEEENSNRGKETISDLQTLLKELAMIEESNEAMSKQLEEQREANKSLKEEVMSYKFISVILTSDRPKFRRELLRSKMNDSREICPQPHLLIYLN